MKAFIHGHWQEINDCGIIRDYVVWYAKILRRAIWILCALALGYFVGGLL